MPQKIITGNWDGKPIWRWETAGERLAAELNQSGWYEGIDHIAQPDLRSDSEVAEEQAMDESFNDHRHD